MVENREAGYIEDVAAAVGITLVIVVILGLFIGAIFLKWQPSQEVVSGIVYNTKNDTFIGGNTKFSVRAAVDTYVSEENESSYCVPNGSPYKDIINRAAVDKNIKVKVTADKYFGFAAPWTCVPNVKVEEVK